MMMVMMMWTWSEAGWLAWWSNLHSMLCIQMATCIVWPVAHCCSICNASWTWIVAHLLLYLAALLILYVLLLNGD